MFKSRLHGLLFHMIFGQAVCTVSHSCTCIATHTRAWYMNADDLVDRVGHTSVLSVLNYRWEQIGFYLACLCSHTREYMYMHVQLRHYSLHCSKILSDAFQFLKLILHIWSPDLSVFVQVVIMKKNTMAQKNQLEWSQWWTTLRMYSKTLFTSSLTQESQHELSNLVVLY